MPQQPLEYGTSVAPAPLLSRRRAVDAAIGLVIGIALTIGTGVLQPTSRVLAHVLMPLPLLSLRYSGNNVGESIAFCIVQWPLYGLVVGYVWPGSLRVRLLTIAAGLACHAAGVVACVTLLP